MKIAFFTDDYLPYVHGVTTSIQNYRQALEALGHEVYIVAPKKSGYDDNDDHVIRMPSVNSVIFENRPISLHYPGMARKLDKYDFDVVHSQTQFYMGGLAYMVAKRKRIPHLTTIHTLFTELIDDYPLAISAGLVFVSIGIPFVFKTKPVLPFGNTKEIMGWSRSDLKAIMKKQGWKLMAEFANHTSGLIAPSQHLAKTLVDHGAKVDCHVLSNGVKLEKYTAARASDSPINKQKDEKFIICVARLSAEKRQATIVESMKYVKTKNARLILVGDGPLREKLEALAETYGVSDRIIFTGPQSGANVAAMMKQADLFTLPSYRFDNQPMVILEAIASGLPVVYCDNKLKEGLTPENALLTKGRSAKSFAVAFDQLLADSDKRAVMSRASKQIAKQFDINRQAKKMVKLYQSAPVIEK
jgi:1,2-diacylglycerol 3-alpha-glucosyltransferase